MAALVTTAVGGLPAVICRILQSIESYQQNNNEASQLAGKLVVMRSLLDGGVIDDASPVVIPFINNLQSHLNRVEEMVTQHFSNRRIRNFALSPEDRQVFNECAGYLQGAQIDLVLALTVGAAGRDRVLRRLEGNQENLLVAVNKVGVSNVEVRRTLRQLRAAATSSGDGTHTPQHMPTVLRSDLAWIDEAGQPSTGPSPSNPRACLLARGGFGAVYRARLKHVGDVAVKIVDMEAAGPDREELDKALLAECSVHLRVSSHRNVVSFFGILRDEEWMGFVTDFAEGRSLASTMRTDAWREGVSISQKVGALRGLISAIAYLHSQSVFHGDIKPHNVLIAGRLASDVMPVLWVCDFGLAETERVVNSSRNSTLLQHVAEDNQNSGGTLGYMAPETVLEQKKDSRSDIFSLSLLLWAALVGEVPFPNLDLRNSAHYAVSVCQNRYRPDIHKLPHTPGKIVEYIRKGWEQVPSARPRAAEIEEVWRESHALLVTAPAPETTHPAQLVSAAPTPLHATVEAPPGAPITQLPAAARHQSPPRQQTPAQHAAQPVQRGSSAPILTANPTVQDVPRPPPVSHASSVTVPSGNNAQAKPAAVITQQPAAATQRVATAAPRAQQVAQRTCLGYDFDWECCLFMSVCCPCIAFGYLTHVVARIFRPCCPGCRGMEVDDCCCL